MAKGVGYQLGRFATGRPKLFFAISGVLLAIFFGAIPLIYYLEDRKQAAREESYKANAARVVAGLKEAQAKRQAELAAMPPEQREAILKQEAEAAAESARVAEAARKAEAASKQAAADAAANRDRGVQQMIRTGQALKASMHNPSSFKLERAVLMADGTACFEFRGTNAFNATILSQKAYAPDLRERNWGGHCGGMSGIDMTHMLWVL